MYARPTMLFPLITLGLLALLTLWINNVVQAPRAKLDGSSRHDPDYYMNNFVTTKTNMNGELEYRLAATEMIHYPDDDSTQLKRPRFTRYALDKPYTQIQSQKGSLSSNGETVEFIDHVKVVRQAFKNRGEMVMQTQQLTMQPKKDIAMTEMPVIITQAPKTVIHATGMIFDKKNKTFTLLHKVKAHYENPRKAAGSYQALTKNTKRQDMQMESMLGASPITPKSKVSPAPSQQPDPKLKFSKDII